MVSMARMWRSLDLRQRTAAHAASTIALGPIGPGCSLVRYGSGWAPLWRERRAGAWGLPFPPIMGGTRPGMGLALEGEAMGEWIMPAVSRTPTTAYARPDALESFVAQAAHAGGELRRRSASSWGPRDAAVSILSTSSSRKGAS